MESDEKPLERASRALVRVMKEGGSLVVLTGAGISAESGVPTFRGEGGLWREYRAEELATPYAFSADPKLVWEWYDWRRGLISKCVPNPAHYTLATMEGAIPDMCLMTQNVDGLHRAAGCEHVLELHGCIWRVRCVDEGKVREDRRVPLTQIPPHCECGSLLRPDVVWFGEGLPRDVLEEAFERAAKCSVMLVIGTSAVVQPAAAIPIVARERGATLIEMNPDPTPLSDSADVSLHGPAGILLPSLWKKVASMER